MKRSKRSAPESPKSQATISSFFSSTQRSISQTTRAESPIDLTIDSDTEIPPQKKQRTSSTFFSTAPPQAEASSSHAPRRDDGFADQWRFQPNETEFKATKPSNTQMHERAKRILIGGDFFVQKDPHGEPGVDEASDSEAEVEIQEDVRGETPGDESDPDFTQLMGHFVNSKAKGKQKAQAQKRGGRKTKVEEIGPSGLPYTPLELQVRELQAKHPGILLMVIVGYKILFYGEDARIASKELGIACFTTRNFQTAMIPVPRREIHLKKLLSKGYKVGIVEQTETAALKKVGDNRSGPFARKLNHLYTSGTYVDELNSVDDLEPTLPPPLMCLVEELRGGKGAGERVNIGMVVITPSTGDVVWDQFEDSSMRIELETRMVHTTPYELLLPASKLSGPTEKLISYITENTISDHRIRIERFNEMLSYTDAFSHLSKFYTDKNKSFAASESFNSGKLMAAIADFPKLVVVALAYCIKYLSKFGIEDCLLETNFFAKFTERTHMLLNGNTLTNLEIYRNETDYTLKGSLMWILDHTSTKFGARMLRSWVGRPLVDASVLRQRSYAIDEIIHDTSPRLTLLRQLLKRLPDLARGLCRIQYGKCTPQELVILLKAFERIAATFNAPDPAGRASFQSPILEDVVNTLPKLKGPVNALLAEINVKKASEGCKDEMWTDLDKYPELDNLIFSIQVIESELLDELKKIRKLLSIPALTYTTVSVEEYLIEINKTYKNRSIPTEWNLVSSTKTTRRYRTPDINKKLAKRAQYKEALAAEAQRVYLAFLKRISRGHYSLLRDVVNKLAVADCLLSLAQVALQEGYVKPEFTQDGELEIVDGRHPMVEVLRSDPFVPNSVSMGGEQADSIIITGPNMGGKSCVVRMIALCAIMAQTGSYVPAKSMKLGLLDGILTRMGASDELSRGRSTFMVEMQETSDILNIATSKSLVILDELGRGTSTFDGMAVASAVLEHLVEIKKCKTLFITHYPHVAMDLERRFPLDVKNMHMGYTEDTRIDGTREVTFLYRLTPGITTESFGVECARLAGVPESILRLASEKAQSMQAATEERIRRNKFFSRLLPWRAR
ncbi:hypothetical protein OBBRIDRAFT_826026 [Obba rivulosa]|uniref:DNA mismatch repair protein MSH3 n=1 Tax=Obba rivulosa TaxID=1052685 RepID=A0A8E2B2X8_9APHY|nr:hypothetical protein OBBRIDRAFT_826026 [Obba rivulosa]